METYLGSWLWSLSSILTSILTSGTQHVGSMQRCWGTEMSGVLPCILLQTCHAAWDKPLPPTLPCLTFHTFVMGALDCPALAKGGISPGPREGFGCGMTSWSPSQPLCAGLAGWLGVATALPGPPQGGSVHVYRKCRTRPGR